MAILKDLIVHGSSRFLNKVYAEELETSAFEADSAVIKKLKADEATVVGLLDVQGELHTNSWTNSNIATIDGSFYITPTIGSDSGNIVFSSVNVASLTGDFTAVNSLYIGDSSSGSTVQWMENSNVLLTGEVKVNNQWLPLGTLLGTLSTNATTSSIGLKELKDNKHNDSSIIIDIRNAIGSTSLEYRNLKISLYQRASNSKLYPMGVYLTALGPNGRTFIDIYGGVQDTSKAQGGGFTKPNVRIGNLSGLDAIGDIAPVGWGIYTTNGYFDGVIVSNRGNIGGWNLTADSIWKNNENFGNANGMYFGANGISLGSTFKVTNEGVLTATAGTIAGWRIESSYLASGTATGPAANTLLLSPNGTSTPYSIAGQNKAGWMITAGNTFGVNKDGGIYATAGKIGGFDIGTSSIKNTKTSYSETTNNGVWVGTDGIGLGKGLFYVTNAGSLTAKSGSIAGWSFNASSLYKTNATPGYNASTMVISTGTASTNNIGGGGTASKTWMISAGTGFGVTTTGTLYCNDAHISGEITATQGKIGGINITNGKLDVSAINIGDLSGEIGGRNLAKGTNITRTWTSANGSFYGDSKICNNIAEGTIITVSIRVDADNVAWNSTTYQRVGCEFNITKTGGGNQYIGVWAGKTLSDGANIVKEFTGSFHGRISKTFTLLGPVNISDNKSIITYAQNFTSGTIKLSNIKIEIGNKATDWSPAPEDIDVAKYITAIDQNGIKIHAENNKSSNYTNLTADGLYIYQNAKEIAKFSSTEARIGLEAQSNVKINKDGITINKGSTQIASYKDSIILGDEANNNLLFLDKSSLSLRSGGEDYLSSNEVFEVGECAETISKTVTSGQASYQWSELTNNTKEIKEVTLSEVLLKEGVDYTFNSTTGTITLTNAPTNSTSKLKVSFIPMNPEAIQKTITFTTPEEEYWLLRSLYSIPQHVVNIFSISLNGTVLTSNQYSYDSSTHILKIPATPTESNAPAAGSTVEVVYTKSLGYYYTLGKRDLTKIGDYSIATGYNCMAAGDKSFAGGNYTYVAGQSSFGYGSGTSDTDCVQVIGNFCGGIGRGVTVYGEGNFGCGNYNAPSSSYIFSVGNGSSTTDRKNAFWVAKSGNARVAGNLSVMNGIQVAGQMRSYKKDGSGTVPLFWYDTKRKSNISISANNVNSGLTCDITLPNHTPMGVVGMRILNSSSSGTNAQYCNLYIYMIVNNSSEDHITFSIKNFASTAAKVDVEFKILYIANEALSSSVEW